MNPTGYYRQYPLEWRLPEVPDEQMSATAPDEKENDQDSDADLAAPIRFIEQHPYPPEWDNPIPDVNAAVNAKESLTENECIILYDVRIGSHWEQWCIPLRASSRSSAVSRKPS